MKQKIIIAITAFISVMSQIALPFAVESAYIERGYFAFGGEWVFTVISIGALFFTIQAVVNMYAEKINAEKTRTAKFETAYRKMATKNFEEDKQAG